MRGAVFTKPDDTCPIRTSTMGFSIRIDEDVSKDTLVQICKRLSEMFGEGHVFKPLEKRGLLNWARWPDKLDGIGMSGKEMRLVQHGKGRVPAIAWPKDVGERVLDQWLDDESLCIRKGIYRTQLFAYGEAPCWHKDELELIRGVFRSARNLLCLLWAFVNAVLAQAGGLADSRDDLAARGGRVQRPEDPEETRGHGLPLRRDLTGLNEACVLDIKGRVSRFGSKLLSSRCHRLQRSSSTGWSATFTTRTPLAR